MILPEGNSKKYIKVVIGVYVLFTIASPIITKFTGESIEVSDVLELDEYIEESENSAKVQNTIESDNQSNIMNIYTSGIKNDMKAKVEAKGYIVNSINVDIADDETYSIEHIYLEVEEETDEQLNENVTDENNENKTENFIEMIQSIEKVDISIRKKDKDNVVENEDTTSGENKLTELKKEELKEYLSSIYEVEEKNITIN